MTVSFWNIFGRTAACSLLALSMVAPSTASAQSIPVTVGADGPNYDACGSWGEVFNLNPNGDNYLSVRDRPSSSGRELDRLGPSTGVAMCTQRGRWIGIVYSKSGQDCGVSTPVLSPRGYTGPCRSGWVFNKYVRVIAG